MGQPPHLEEGAGGTLGESPLIIWVFVAEITAEFIMGLTPCVPKRSLWIWVELLIQETS
jgi:hypothetical protein